MSAVTGIAWTDHTFNPWWGCKEVSPGCAHCYAKAFDKRIGRDDWGEDRRFFGDAHWNEPHKWNRKAAAGGIRRRVFCASMADVFEDRPDLEPWRLRLWALVVATPHLDWQLLTKRPENVAALAHPNWHRGEWPRNAWLGVTAENQTFADIRIPLLLREPAPVRFVSYEPALGPVDFDLFLRCRKCRGRGWYALRPFQTPLPDATPCEDCIARARRAGHHVPEGHYAKAHGSLDWLIVGGESGPRPSTGPGSNQFGAGAGRPVAAPAASSGLATPRPAPVVSSAPGAGPAASKMGRAFLTVLAQRRRPLQKRQLLTFAGYRASGDVSVMFAALLRDGLVEASGPSVLSITDAGVRALGDYEPLPTGAALRSHLLATLPKMESAFLRAIVDAHPAAIAKGEILARTGYKASGDVSVAFAKLVTLGYAEKVGVGQLRAAEELFEA